MKTKRNYVPATIEEIVVELNAGYAVSADPVGVHDYENIFED